ncbi:MAG: hypothetical protein P4M11_02640 [Candidatus Pacebacteria bacterium]|nr:hypothetical protein [Candidatus Paceibacterota bacterium]
MYGIEEYGDYALCTLFGLMSGYTFMWVRKKLMINETISRSESWKWRSLLMLLAEGVAVCTESEVLFSNDGLRTILEAEQLVGEVKKMEEKEGKDRDDSASEESRNIFGKVRWRNKR